MPKCKQLRRERRTQNRENYLRNREGRKRQWLELIKYRPVRDDPTEEHVKALLMVLRAPRANMADSANELTSRHAKRTDEVHLEALRLWLDPERLEHFLLSVTRPLTVEPPPMLPKIASA